MVYIAIHRHDVPLIHQNIINAEVNLSQLCELVQHAVKSLRT